MASQKYRRILTIVIDSIGVGDAPDADKYKSNGADTLGHMSQWWVDNQGVRSRSPTWSVSAWAACAPASRSPA